MTEQSSANLTPAQVAHHDEVSDQTPAVIAVAGEMQPWTDGPVEGSANHRGSRLPAGGEALAALVADVLPVGGRVLLLGPHDADILSVVAERAEDVTALRRSPSDATALAEAAPANVRVVSGSLDGFVRTTTDRFDLVVAADGLDRVLSTDSPNLEWAARLELVTSLVSESGVVVLYHGNDVSVLELLDERPDKDRHGDDDWFPIHDDTARPTSLAALTEILGSFGLEVSRAWSSHGDERPWLFVADGVELDRPAGPLVDLAVRATQTTSRPLLADPEEALRRAARSGQLAMLGTGWLVTTGGRPGRDVYAVTDALGSLVVADVSERQLLPVAAQPGARIPVIPTPIPEADGDTTGTQAGESPAPDPQAPEAPTDDASAMLIRAEPTTLAALDSRASVAAELLRHAAAENVPAFRSLAGQLGSWWLGDEGPGRRALSLDDVFLRDGLEAGWSFLSWIDPPEAAEGLAAAWWLLADELSRSHRRHPWPPWVADADLVALWLGMCGFEVANASESQTIARGRVLANALSLHRLGGPVPTRDLRALIADAEQARLELFEARGHIFGLERTIGFRDKQLRTRELRIRELRKKIAKVERIKATKVFRVADKARTVARDPRKVVGGVRRKAAKGVKRVLRRG